MSYRAVPFAPGEWYHCYTRSIDKQAVFRTSREYERFLETLYLSNASTSVRRHDLSKPAHTDLFSIARGEPLVAIGAYCLMPNHFHLLLKETTEGGISKFMHRVGTSFTKYFNLKNDRVGNLFIKPFRAKHIADDLYYKRVAQYIHLNPAELWEPGWKSGQVRNIHSLNKRLTKYKYSSLPDYIGVKRPYNHLLDDEAKRLLKDMPSFSHILEEAAAYYSTLAT